MTLELEYVRGTLELSVGPLIESTIGGNDNVSFVGHLAQVDGNTMGDQEFYRNARWSLEFRSGAEFAVEVTEPTPPSGARDPGDSGSVSVTLPMGLLPAFHAIVGPNRDRPVQVEITPHEAKVR